MKRAKRLVLLMAGWLLSGCATSYLVDNNVQSFSSLAALPAQPAYRFERLPSQRAPAQSQLEALADGALHNAGLRRDDAKPVYSVQVSARLGRVLSPWASPWYGWGWDGGWGMGLRHGRYGYGPRWGGGLGGSYWGMESPWYHREVSVIMRELASNRVLFESYASNDGPWVDDNQVFAAMFRAALEGFPQPPTGPRRVDIRIGG